MIPIKPRQPRWAPRPTRRQFGGGLLVATLTFLVVFAARAAVVMLGLFLVFKGFHYVGPSFGDLALAAWGIVIIFEGGTAGSADA